MEFNPSPIDWSKQKWIEDTNGEKTKWSYIQNSRNHFYYFHDDYQARDSHVSVYVRTKFGYKLDIHATKIWYNTTKKMVQKTSWTYLF